MYLIAIAWIYVVLLMAVAEALSPQGTVLGAVITFVFYGVLPLSILMYILGAPGRRRLRQRAESNAPSNAPSNTPNGSGHAPGHPVAPKREEP